MTETYKQYLRAFLALLAALLVGYQSAASDQVITSGETVQMFVVGLGAFATYLVPSLPGYWVAKTVSMAITTALTAAAGYLAEGQEMTPTLWRNVVIAGVITLVSAFTPGPETAAARDVSPYEEPEF